MHSLIFLFIYSSQIELHNLNEGQVLPASPEISAVKHDGPIIDQSSQVPMRPSLRVDLSPPSRNKSIE